MLIAIGGVIRLRLTENLFTVFFSEDMAVLRGATPKAGHIFLSLSRNPVLMHNVDLLFSYGSSVSLSTSQFYLTYRSRLTLPHRIQAITLSGVVFLIGIITFVFTVQFGGDPMLLRVRHPGFIAVSLVPPVLYLANFWNSMLKCTFQHRQARDSNADDTDGDLVDHLPENNSIRQMKDGNDA